MGRNADQARGEGGGQAHEGVVTPHQTFRLHAAPFFVLVPFVLSLDALDVTTRLLRALATLGRAVAAGPASLSASVVEHLRVRLDQIALHMLLVATRLGATAPRQPIQPRPNPAPPAQSVKPLRRPTCPRVALPRRFGWLLAALPGQAPPIADEISTLLQDPAIAELFHADPQTRRLLQPLCRMLGLTIPPHSAPAPQSMPTPPPSPPRPSLPPASAPGQPPPPPRAAIAAA